MQAGVSRAVRSRVHRSSSSPREEPQRRQQDNDQRLESLDRIKRTIGELLEASGADHPLLRTLCVTRLPKEPRECDIESFFARFAEVERVFVSRIDEKKPANDAGAFRRQNFSATKPRFALVTFRNKSGAEKAFENTKSHKRLRITWLLEKLRLRDTNGEQEPGMPNTTQASREEGTFLSSLPSFLTSDEPSKDVPKRNNRHLRKSESLPSAASENWSCRKPTKSLSVLSDEDAKTFRVIASQPDPIGLKEEFGMDGGRFTRARSLGTKLVNVTTLPKMPLVLLPPELNMAALGRGYIQNYYLGTRKTTGRNPPPKKTFAYNATMHYTSRGAEMVEKTPVHSKIILNICWTWPLRPAPPEQQVQNLKIKAVPGVSMLNAKKSEAFPVGSWQNANVATVEGFGGIQKRRRPARGHRKERGPTYAEAVKNGLGSMLRPIVIQPTPPPVPEPEPEPALKPEVFLVPIPRRPLLPVPQRSKWKHSLTLSQNPFLRVVAQIQQKGEKLPQPTAGGKNRKKKKNKAEDQTGEENKSKNQPKGGKKAKAVAEKPLKLRASPAPRFQNVEEVPPTPEKFEPVVIMSRRQRKKKNAQ